MLPQPHATPSPSPGDGAVVGDAAERATAAKRRLLALGQIVSLMARHPQYRAMPLADIESLVGPALASGQYLVVEAHTKDRSAVAPIAMALWAVVSSEIDARLSTNLEQPPRLAPNEWRSGDIPWLVAAAGDQRVLGPVLQKLQEAAHKGRALKMRLKQPDGTMRVGTLDQLPVMTSESARPPAPQT